MTVLHLDPPRPNLRLLTSVGPARPAERDHRYRDGAQLFGDARALYCEVLQAALASGTAVDADALRVVLATKQAAHPGPIRRFTGDVIWQLLYVDIVAWCRRRHLDAPTGAVQSLAVTIDHLTRSGTFDPASDHVDELYEALDDCTGGWYEHAQRTPPGGGRRSLPSKRGPKRR